MTSKPCRTIATNQDAISRLAVGCAILPSGPVSSRTGLATQAAPVGHSVPLDVAAQLRPDPLIIPGSFREPRLDEASSPFPSALGDCGQPVVQEVAESAAESFLEILARDRGGVLGQ